MANYIGNVPASGEFKRLDSITTSFDGTTTQFNLTYGSVSQTAGDSSQLIVSLNGIIQEPLESYTLGIGGSSIVFSSAPLSGDSCHIVLLGGVGATTTPTDGSVTASKLDASLKDYYEDEFTANGSATNFTLSRQSVGVNQLLVTIDGIVQPTSAYTASGTTLTISPALPNGTNIRVVHMGVKAGVFVPQSGSVGLNELDLVGVDTRYYTQTAADATFETITNVALKAPIANPSFTGDVGIGTSSPAAKLHVAGAILASSEVISQQLTLGGVVGTGVAAAAALRTGSTKTAWLLGAQYNVNNAFEITPSDATGGAVFNTPAFVLTSSGNLLVGGTSNVGSARTSIQNASGVTLNLDKGTGASLQFTAGGVTDAQIAGNAAGALVVYTGSSLSEKMRIDSSGNLGLGVTPSAWGSGSSAFQNAAGNIWRFGTDNIYFGQNYYFNGTNRIYSTSNNATEYQQGNGLHRWFTAPSGTAGNAISFTEKVRIDSDGLKFNGDSAAANALDDYEEGTWTPSIGGDATYGGRNGRYTKIGNLVTIQFAIEISTKGTGSSVLLSGLPFAAGNIGNVQTGCVSYFNGIAAGVYFLAFYVENAATTCFFVSTNSLTGSVVNGAGVFGNGATIYGAASYYVS